MEIVEEYSSGFILLTCFKIEDADKISSYVFGGMLVHIYLHFARVNISLCNLNTSMLPDEKSEGGLCRTCW